MCAFTRRGSFASLSARQMSRPSSESREFKPMYEDEIAQRFVNYSVLIGTMVFMIKGEKG